MKILVLGAGLQGSAAVFDLLRNPDVEEVGCADVNEESLAVLRDRLQDRRLNIHTVNLKDREAASALMAPYDGCLSAVNYWLNLDLTRCAIESGTHFCDLGGNNDIVSQQLKLDTLAFEAGVTVIPDCGLAPGLATILGAQGIRRLDEVTSVKIRVGGLPQDPKPPLNYQLVFSVEGLLNEYVERSIIIRDGVKLSVEPLTEIETIEFPDPFGKLEAFHTSGGLSTLASTFAGKVRNLDYKTIRYAGHCELMHPLRALGFLDQTPVQIGDTEMRPREMSAHILKDLLQGDDPDVVLVRVTIQGSKFGGRRRLEYELIDYADAENQQSAMMRCTAYPASITLQMIANGRIDRRGVVSQERVVPVEEMIEELKGRGLEIVERQS